jgi:hypothetical protein
MRKKIDCMSRLFDLLKCRNDILEYLREEKLITDDTMQGILHEHHSGHAAKIVSMLAEFQKEDKLQLVDYEWTILPKELVQLTVVSRNNKKVWVYTV